MPSLSPGSKSPSSFAQILPGAPAEAQQALTTFTFRWKRYIVYISGKQLNILRSPTELVQAITFDEELVAVRAEGEESAKIAVASSANVWVLESTTNGWNQVTWRKALLLKREDAGDKARSLSWGIDGELLVGGSRLVSLFSVLPTSREGSPVRTSAEKGHLEERHVLWSKCVPSALQAACFSPSASLIASFGPRDRLVKIWRRLSFEEGLFDYTYLPHPGPVTHIEWRRPDAPKLEEEAEESDDARAKSYGSRNEEDQELLYTFCADGLLRVWKTGGLHELEVMVLHTSIDLVGAIPHSPSMSSTGAAAPKPTRYAFVLSSGTLTNAINAAVSKQHVGKLSHSLEHLKEISSKNPDAVITLDGLGRMSAWGLQTIGHRRRPSTPSGNSKQPFHIAHAEDLDWKLPVGSNARFEAWFDGDQLNVVAHSFEGSISWWQGGVEQFLSPATKGSDRLVSNASWSGNKAAIAGLRSHPGMDGLLAWTSNGRLAHLVTAPMSQLRLAACSIPGKEGSQKSQIMDAYSVDDQNHTIIVDNSTISVIGASGTLLTSAVHSQDQALRLLRIQANDSQSNQSFILLSQSGSYTVVTVSGLSTTSQVQVAIGKRRELPIMGDVPNSSSVWKDVQVVSHPRRPTWLRLVAVNEEGAVWRRDVPLLALLEDASKATEAPLSFLSGLAGPSLLDATCDVAVLASADGSSIVVLDLKSGYVEHRQELRHVVQYARLNVCKRSSSDQVGDTNTTLAIAYSDSVDILAQARYEQASSAEQYTWHHLKRMSIAGIGLRISAIAWLPRDELVVAAGHSLFRSDGLVAGAEVVPELRDRLDLKPTTAIRSNSLMHALRLPLVSWHPHFLHQLVVRGQLHSATGILRRLERSLRFYTEGDVLHPLLNATPQDISAGKANADNALLDSDTINSLQQQLGEIDLPKTSDTEQNRLKIVLGTIIYMQDHVGSLDENGLRYLFSWKLHVLELESKRDSSSTDNNKSTSNGDDVPTPVVPAMSWREIVFAYHSESQQPILEALHNYYGEKLDWPTVRQLGIPAWLHAVKAAQSEGSDLASLEQIFETLAQKAFRSTYPPDPTKASLFFLALKKKATLLALWRIAVGNKEQRTTSNFLKRDFTLEENRTAARKNAYALMGKRRFEYAAAFFLLSNDPASAIRILAGQCQDLPLAIAVARVYCDDGSPELMKFMEERVLPSARQAGDRWLLSWVHEMMGHTHLAAQALVIPVDKFEVKDAERLPRHWQQDDPLTLKLYQHLRDRPVKPGQNKKSRSLGGEQHEYRAILRAARILRKMGLWLIALELVSNWHFATPPQLNGDDNVSNGEGEMVATNGAHEQSGDATTPSILDSFSAPSTTQTPVPDEAKAPKPQSAPRSLLDDFDSLSLQASPADKAKSDREAKAAELMAKLKAKKEAASKPAGDAEDEKKKKAPTQFKEPEANSILDSFGF